MLFHILTTLPQHDTPLMQLDVEESDDIRQCYVARSFVDGKGQTADYGRET